MHAHIHTLVGLPHAYIHTCMHACIHTCMHAYIHTCMHTYTPAGLPQLVRVLVGSLAEGPEGPASDAASSALIANVVLSLAHVALDGGAAIALVAIPGTLPALASLMRPAPEGAVGGWSAVRGNAVTALLHLLHVAEGKAAMVPRESDETASAPAVAEGEEGVEEGAYECAVAGARGVGLTVG